MRLTDPNNVFIRELTLGGSEGLKKLQYQELWHRITEKYEHARGDPNIFLNSLTKDEYAEYINDDSHMSFEIKQMMQNNTDLNKNIIGDKDPQSIELNDIGPVTELKDKF